MMAATIKSVEKAIDLLFPFDGDRTVMDVKTIAEALGIPLRTTHRLANTLRNRNVVTIEERTGLCRLSPRRRHQGGVCLPAARGVGSVHPPERLNRYGPNTVTGPQRLKRELLSIRRARFAVSHQEFIPGVRSLGVPLLDATDRVMGSLGLVGPDTRLTRARALKPLMLETAAAISAAVWGRAD
jgi:DNA-binding IclR family transcriptional regulator